MRSHPMCEQKIYIMTQKIRKISKNSVQPSFQLFFYSELKADQETDMNIFRKFSKKGVLRRFHGPENVIARMRVDIFRDLVDQWEARA